VLASYGMSETPARLERLFNVLTNGCFAACRSRRWRFTRVVSEQSCCYAALSWVDPLGVSHRPQPDKWRIELTSGNRGVHQRSHQNYRGAW
jgi:hypothetical protein